MSDQMDARVFPLLMAARMVGNYLYFWGGEDSDEGGFDCSGFVSTALLQAARAWPQLYTGTRTTAQGLYDHFHEIGCPDITDVSELKPGCLLFYRRPDGSISHVAIHAANVPHVRLRGDNGEEQKEVGPIAFEASGGRADTKSPRAALCRSAGVRVTASDRHGAQQWVAKDPFVLLGS